MAIVNNPRHLALVKRRARALREAKGDLAWSFFVLVDRTSGDVLLHIDERFEAEVFRNPVIIAKRLKRYKSLKPKTYQDFLADPRSLVSLAGRVSADPGGSGLVFERTVRTGRGRAPDLRLALKTFRMLRGRSGEIEDGGVEEMVGDRVRVESARALFGSAPATPALVLDGLYEHLGSVDALAETIDALADAVRARPGDTALVAMQDAFEEALEQLDAWDPDVGMQGVAQGFDELIGKEDVEAAAREVAEAAVDEALAGWTDTVDDVRRRILAGGGDADALLGAWPTRVAGAVDAVRGAADRGAAVSEAGTRLREAHDAFGSSKALKAFDDAQGTDVIAGLRSGTVTLRDALRRLKRRLGEGG